MKNKIIGAITAAIVAGGIGITTATPAFANPPSVHHCYRQYHDGWIKKYTYKLYASRPLTCGYNKYVTERNGNLRYVGIVVIRKPGVLM